MQNKIERLAIEVLGLAPDTVQRWRQSGRGRVPDRHRIALMSAARERGFELDPADFDGLVLQKPRRTTGAPQLSQGRTR